MTGLEILLGIPLAIIVLIIIGQSHNKPGSHADRDFRCMYCPWMIHRGQKIVYGNKGWGHVECVEFARPRRRTRW